MQKTKKNFRELSDKRCIDCGQPLKKNLVERNPDANRCSTCHKIFKFKGKNFVLLELLKAKQKKKRAKWQTI
jgi:uncharacterized protein with PIN domain